MSEPVATLLLAKPFIASPLTLDFFFSSDNAFKAQRSPNKEFLGRTDSLQSQLAPFLAELGLSELTYVPENTGFKRALKGLSQTQISFTFKYLQIDGI